MCSIGGVVSKKGVNVYPFLLDLLFSQKHRGSDGFGITVNETTIKSVDLKKMQKKFLKGSSGICHSLLSITGHAIQPLKFPNKKMRLVHNGQIYNFKDLAQKKLSNDSKAIANYLNNAPQKMISSFMKKAVGTYSIGVLEKNSLTAFRDPVGVKPLWFGENQDLFAFASEPLALKKLGINFPAPLKPGHLIGFSRKGFAQKKVFDLNDFKKTVPKKSSIKKLQKAFETSIGLRTKGLKECAVFFSGGVDSSLIAKAVSAQVKKTVLFTAGIKNSPDLVFSKCTAKKLGLKIVVCEIKKEEIPKLSLKVLRALTYFDLMQLGIALPLFVCAKKAKNNGFKVAFSGQGSDEVFCGYSNYQKIFAEKGPKKVREQVWSALSNMWSRNLFREDIVSMRHSIEHRLPFLDLNFLRTAMALPLTEKISSPTDNLRKHAIRKIAKNLGVPSTAFNRKKKAVQYGSGVQKELLKLF